MQSINCHYYYLLSWQVKCLTSESTWAEAKKRLIFFFFCNCIIFYLNHEPASQPPTKQSWAIAVLSHCVVKKKKKNMNFDNFFVWFFWLTFFANYWQPIKYQLKNCPNGYEITKSRLKMPFWYSRRLQKSSKQQQTGGERFDFVTENKLTKLLERPHKHTPTHT